jgi:hypothetical protein
MRAISVGLRVTKSLRQLEHVVKWANWKNIWETFGKHGVFTNFEVWNGLFLKSVKLNPSKLAWMYIFKIIYIYYIILYI